MDRNNNNRFINNQSGQSAVEYILLFAVVISMLTLVFQSQAYKDLFGKENGKFTSVFKREIEYSYRHALPGVKRFERPNYNSGNHDSYKGRFFGAQDEYPKK